ncbi:MAG: YggT family protein [Magnetococcales bacterium]|nr:YggT family protein [Magnetococcales bacterium]
MATFSGIEQRLTLDQEFVMGIFHSIGALLGFILQIYSWMILARVLLSWVNPDPYNPVVQFLARLTDPVLRPLQRLIPSIGGLDLSPIVAMMGIMMAQRLVAALFSGVPAGLAVGVLAGEVLTILHLFLTLYMLLLVARGGINIHSWLTFKQGRSPRFNLRHPVNLFLYQVTEPLLRHLRRWVPTFGPLDVSPLAAAFLLLMLLFLIQSAGMAVTSPAESVDYILP